MNASGRHRMPDREHLTSSESLHAEWINGEAVAAPRPTVAHQQATRRTANFLEQALPGLIACHAVTVKLAPDMEPIPDVTVTAGPVEGLHITQTPILVAEVLSPETWANDTVVKSAAYLLHGVSQYWLIDPTGRSIDVFQSDESGWHHSGHLDAKSHTAVVDVPPYGTIQVDLETLLGPPTP